MDRNAVKQRIAARIKDFESRIDQLRALARLIDGPGAEDLVDVLLASDASDSSPPATTNFGKIRAFFTSQGNVWRTAAEVGEALDIKVGSARDVMARSAAEFFESQQVSEHAAKQFRLKPGMGTPVFMAG